MDKKKHTGFTGTLGFVLSAAGSAVGVGNIWRFPYLAAKDGGGLFILIYLALVLTFGFTLLTTDIAIGRKTKKPALQAFGSINPKWNFLGKLTFLVPAMIMTYYTVIGGWVTKYVAVYVTGQGHAAAADGFFGSFITAPVAPIVFMLIFLAITSLVVFFGVDKGIERFSKVIMPGLVILIVGITIFALNLTHTDANGVTRTGLEGLKVYLIPNFEGMTVSKFLKILLDAMSQLFFSLSVSMGIMITYGSYVKKDVNLNKSIRQIELFDTGVALIAGAMIVPTVYMFSGTEGMLQGPSLMFVSLPKVFEAMGPVGNIIAIAFFLMLGFAAVTSSVSILETLVANCMDIFHMERRKMCGILTVVSAAAAVVICLGYNLFYFEFTLPNGNTAQLLDIMDYISNSFLMPLISFLTCIFVGWIVKPEWIEDEMKIGAGYFSKKKLYSFMIKFVAPAIMAVLFLPSTGIMG